MFPWPKGENETKKTSLPTEDPSKLVNLPPVKFKKLNKNNISNCSCKAGKRGDVQIVPDSKKGYFTCKLNYPGLNGRGVETLKILTAEDVIISTQDHFVAGISVEHKRLIELINKSLPNAPAKQKILECLAISKVLRDDRFDDFEKVSNELLKHAKLALENASKDLSCAQFVYKIISCLPNTNNSGSCQAFLRDLKGVSNLSELGKKIDIVSTEIDLLQKRHRQICLFPNYLDEQGKIVREFRLIGTEAATNHCDVLKRYAPVELRSKISKLNNLEYGRAFLVRVQDCQMFSDLYEVLKSSLTLEKAGTIFKNHVDIFYSIITTSSLSPSKNFIPLTSSIYPILLKLYLKHLPDLNSIDYIDCWTVGNGNCHLDYHFVRRLLNHFNPKTYSSSVSLSDELKSEKLNSYKICGDKVAWIYLLQRLLSSVLTANNSSSLILTHRQNLTNICVDYIKNSSDENHAAFSLVVDGFVEYLAKICVAVNSKDFESLVEIQVGLLKRAMEPDNSQFLLNSFLSIINEFNRFWHCKQTVLDKLKEKNLIFQSFNKRIIGFGVRFLDLLVEAMKPAQNGIMSDLNVLLRYVTQFNDFLVDLNTFDYKYYAIACKNRSITKKNVTGKNPNLFVITGSTGDCSNLPPFYLLNVLDKWMSLLETVVVSTNLPFSRWNQSDRVKAGAELLSAYTKAAVYVNEQKQYESFDNFESLCTKYFENLINSEQNSSLEVGSFLPRLERIIDSLVFCRKHSEISPEEALKLMKNENHSVNEHELEYCFSVYDGQFQKLINSEISSIVAEAKSLAVKLSSENFERQKLIQGGELVKETIPKLLAYLAMVWSKTASEDIKNVDLLKPHCIQVLCVFVLFGLGVDAESGPKLKNLIVRVLTGQGKSVILGLVSAMWSLLNYNVYVLCYTKYLSSRDEEAFSPFFKEFGIRHKIVYGTFDLIADKFLEVKQVHGNKTFCISDLVNDSITQDGQNSSKGQLQLVGGNPDNSILLIDEIDVFFSPAFYGNTYGRLTLIHRKFFAEIQKKIWSIVNENPEKSDETILNDINSFSRNDMGDLKDEYESFIRKPITFKLITQFENEKQIVNYTPTKLLSDNLIQMIKDAKLVKKGNNSRFKLKNGLIYYIRSETGVETRSTYCGYQNLFYYFKLKGEDYCDHDLQNYGYMSVLCGQISFGKIPTEYFWLLLGVTGSIPKPLSQEAQVVKESYNISSLLMPSFFGRSNLVFNPTNDFKVVQEENEWLETIYNHANSKVSTRSIIVCFEDETKLDQFYKTYKTKIANLRKLTANYPNDKEKKSLINDEAGRLGCVLLITREMCRGIDFKSSKTVESGGGVHVIGSFFSTDVKEEVQSQGRTARNGLKGSYEQVLCLSHLVEEGLVSKASQEPITYALLDEQRDALQADFVKRRREAIEKANKLHAATIEFNKSFCSK